jgi:transposase
MRRTEALQGVRMAVFLNILSRWESAELNQEEAAELLGVSERTFRRWTRRYEEEGEAGLLDRRLGKASGRRVPVDRAEEVERLCRERYQGFTVKHFHEHLVKDHGFGWGYTWTKLHLQWMGVVGKAPRKGAHRRKRERRPLPGMMLHQDGSRHAWLEGQGALDLIRDHGRRDGRDLLGVSGRGGGHGLDLPGAEGGVRQARPADEPLHRPRGALLSHPQSRRRRARPRPSFRIGSSTRSRLPA